MPDFDHEQIARMAYRFWEQRGRPQGSSEVDWCRAEAEMKAHRRLMARIGVGSLARLLGLDCYGIRSSSPSSPLASASVDDGTHSHAEPVGDGARIGGHTVG